MGEPATCHLPCTCFADSVSAMWEIEGTLLARNEAIDGLNLDKRRQLFLQ